MADIEIRNTLPEDVPLLAGNLRRADQGEMAAYGFRDPTIAIQRSVDGSMLCWTGLVNGDLAAILGVGPISLLRGIGSPWMMGTPLLDRNIREMIRRTPEYLGRMETMFPKLVNWVYAGNTSSKRWLRSVGFKLEPPQPLGPKGQLFHRFSKG